MIFINHNLLNFFSLLHQQHSVSHARHADLSPWFRELLFPCEMSEWERFFHHYSCTTSIIWCMMKISKLIKLYGVVWFLGDPQWKASFFIFTTSLETFLPWIHTIGILLLPLFFAIIARRKKWKTARVTQCTHINAIKHLFFILLGNWILSPFSSSHLRISIPSMSTHCALILLAR